MSSPGSITQLIEGIRGQNEEDLNRIWNLFFPRLINIARKRLPGAAQRMADEEDVALDALNSVFQGLKEGRFQELHNRDDLWRLLVTVTVHKSIGLIRHQGRAIRGSLEVRGDSVFAVMEGEGKAGGFDGMPGGASPPDLVMEMEEEIQHLPECPEKPFRSLVLLKLAGCTEVEIAEELRCSRATVQRWTQRIRELWQRQLPSPS